MMQRNNLQRNDFATKGLAANDFLAKQLHYAAKRPQTIVVWCAYRSVSFQSFVRRNFVIAPVRNIKKLQH